MWLDKAAAWLAFLILALAAVLWVFNGDTRQVDPVVQRAVEMGYFPCASEDSAGPCYWDASRQGNGQGRSFVITDDNEVFYGGEVK